MRIVTLSPAFRTMDSSTKPAHKFSIWSLVGPGAAAQSRAPEESHAPAAASTPDQTAPAARVLNDRNRRPAGRLVRPSLRPFGAKCMLPTGAKLSCETKRVEPERIELTYNEQNELGPALNMKVGLDLDFFGFVRGTVSASSATGFAMAPDLIYHEMLVAKLAELYTPAGSLDEERSNLDRLMARITLRDPACVYQLMETDTNLYHAKIALLSHKVATLRTAQIQRAGTRLILGRALSYAGTVVRSFESGFTVEFDELLAELHEHLTFC
jgi:hypothetical protein